jgi:hypothetical protein
LECSAMANNAVRQHQMPQLKLSWKEKKSSNAADLTFFLFWNKILLCNQLYLEFIIQPSCILLPPAPMEKGMHHHLGFHCCLVLRNFHSYLNLHQPPPWSVSAINTEERPSTSKKLTTHWRLCCLGTFLAVDYFKLTQGHFFFLAIILLHSLYATL